MTSSQPDPKKLATGFLLVAVVATASVSTLSGVFSGRATNEPTTGQNGTAEGTNGIRTSPSAAFVEESADNTKGQVVPSTYAIMQPTTLSERLAKIIAEQIRNGNPEGPTVQNSESGAELPDLDATVAALTSDPEALRTARDVIAVEPLEPLSSVVVIPFTDDGFAQYVRQFNDVIKATILGPSFADTLNQSPTLGVSNTVDETLGQAERKLEVLSVPAPFKEFHIAALRALVRLRAVHASLRDASADPVRSALLFQVRGEQADEALAAFTYAWQQIRVDPKNASASERFSSLFRGALGIKTAYAWTPVDCDGPVCVAMAAALVATAAAENTILKQSVKEFFKKLALEILKDVLIHQLVKQTIEWIQGGGKPQFVTDWRGFLEKAANKAAGIALYRIEPQFCSSFGPLIQIALLPVNLAADKPVLCSLSQIVGNVKEFADDFSNGGWIAYGAALQPQNNFFGALIQSKGITDREAHASRNEAQNDAQASEGWLSTKVCVSWGDFIPDNCGALATCQPERRCKQYEVTTPGRALGYNIYNALGSPIHRIVNSEDIAALVSALINAALTKLVALAKSATGSYSSINPGLANLDASTIGPQAGIPPDFSSCNTAQDAAGRQECIDNLCQTSGYPGPPCYGAAPPPAGPGEPPICGNNSCEPNENCAGCSADCGSCPPNPGSYCGDGYCDVDKESWDGSGAKLACPQDCPWCGDGKCWVDQKLAQETCNNCQIDCGPCTTAGICCSGSPRSCSITSQTSCVGFGGRFRPGSTCQPDSCSCGAIGGLACVNPPDTGCPISNPTDLGTTEVGGAPECTVACCQ